MAEAAVTSTNAWRDRGRVLWRWARPLGALCAAVWVADGLRETGVALAVGLLVFVVSWIALTLLGLAILHPWAAAKVLGWLLLGALGFWVVETGLEALSVKSLFILIVLLLLFGQAARQ